MIALIILLMIIGVPVILAYLAVESKGVVYIALYQIALVVFDILVVVALTYPDGLHSLDNMLFRVLSYTMLIYTIFVIIMLKRKELTDD